GEIAAVVAFSDLALWLGFAGLAGILFLVAPLALPAALHAPRASPPPTGAALVVLVALYFFWSARQRPLRLRGWSFTPPRPGLSAGATAGAALDWLTRAP